MSDSQHPLETEYGLTAYELLDALQARFRARVTLEGAVAEVQLAAILSKLQYEGIIARFEPHDEDGKYDFTLYLPERGKTVRVECKNVRNSKKLQVEIQKTRASKTDPGSRYYDASHFDIIAVCLGKKTKNWKQFLFSNVADLSHHTIYPEKLAVMHSLPLLDSVNHEVWFSNLRLLLEKKFSTA